MSDAKELKLEEIDKRLKMPTKIGKDDVVIHQL